MPAAVVFSATSNAASPENSGGSGASVTSITRSEAVERARSPTPLEAVTVTS